MAELLCVENKITISRDMHFVGKEDHKEEDSTTHAESERQ
jgi:hypothetical protein